MTSIYETLTYVARQGVRGEWSQIDGAVCLCSLPLVISPRALRYY